MPFLDAFMILVWSEETPSYWCCGRQKIDADDRKRCSPSRRTPIISRQPRCRCRAPLAIGEQRHRNWRTVKCASKIIRPKWEDCAISSDLPRGNAQCRTSLQIAELTVTRSWWVNRCHPAPGSANVRPVSKPWLTLLELEIRRKGCDFAVLVFPQARKPVKYGRYLEGRLYARRWADKNTILLSTLRLLRTVYNRDGDWFSEAVRCGRCAPRSLVDRTYQKQLFRCACTNTSLDVDVATINPHFGPTRFNLTCSSPHLAPFRGRRASLGSGRMEWLRAAFPSPPSPSKSLQ